VKGTGLLHPFFPKKGKPVYEKKKANPKGCSSRRGKKKNCYLAASRGGGKEPHQQVFLPRGGEKSSSVDAGGKNGITPLPWREAVALFYRFPNSQTFFVPRARRGRKGRRCTCPI